MDFDFDVDLGLSPPWVSCGPAGSLFFFFAKKLSVACMPLLATNTTIISGESLIATKSTPVSVES